MLYSYLIDYSAMDKSPLQQPLTSEGAIHWLKDTLGHPSQDSEAKELADDIENSDTKEDPMEALKTIMECTWKSDEDFLAFFNFAATELAKAAFGSDDNETPNLFSEELVQELNMSTPFYDLWKKAKELGGPVAYGDIDMTDWNNTIDYDLRVMPLIRTIPMAMAYGTEVLTDLRNNALQEIDEAQEEFLGEFCSFLTAGYNADCCPTEIVNIPSSRILCEIFSDWTMYPDIWTPSTIRRALESPYADEKVKGLIAKVLRGEDGMDPERWEEHVDYCWDEDDLKELLQLCE